MPVSHYKLLLGELGEPVGRGATKPRFCIVHGIAKSNDSLPLTVSIEFICARLAYCAGLPVAPPTIVYINKKPAFVSLKFGENLPPMSPQEFDFLVENRRQEAMGITLFDAWTGNSDRNDGNLSLTLNDKIVLLFDFSHAFCAAKIDQFLATPADDLIIRPAAHLVAQKLKSLEHLEMWSERFSGIPEYYIRETVQDAVEYKFPEKDAEAMIDHLLKRRGHLVDMVTKRQDQFPALEIP